MDLLLRTHAKWTSAGGSYHPAKRTGGRDAGAVCRGWTYRKAQRLAGCLGSISQHWLTGGFDLVLTQPGQMPWGDVMRAWNRMLKRCQRQWSGLAGVWVKENQERGSLHLHQLWLVGLDVTEFEERAEMLEALRDWVPRNWSECLGVEYARTSVHNIRSGEGMTRYLSGHLMKGQQKLCPDGERPGKWWGRFGILDQYMSPEVMVRLEGGCEHAVVRAMDMLRLSQARARAAYLSANKGDSVARSAWRTVARLRRRRAYQHIAGFGRDVGYAGMRGLVRYLRWLEADGQAVKFES